MREHRSFLGKSSIGKLALGSVLISTSKSVDLFYYSGRVLPVFGKVHIMIFDIKSTWNMSTHSHSMQFGDLPNLISEQHNLRFYRVSICMRQYVLISHTPVVHVWTEFYSISVSRVINLMTARGDSHFDTTDL